MPGHLKRRLTLRRLITGLLTLTLMNAFAIQQAMASLPGHVT
jgi:hypothetical protein